MLGDQGTGSIYLGVSCSTEGLCKARNKVVSDLSVAMDPSTCAKFEPNV